MSKWTLVKELHAPVRKHFLCRKYKMVSRFHTFQIDLIDIQQFSKENSGNKYILVAIDVFSKYCYTIPLKSKNSKDSTSGMKAILLKLDRYPMRIHCDKGTEFYNKPFKKLLSDYNIHLYSTYSDKKASICERVIRTIKTNLWKMFSFRGNYCYTDILQEITEKYNNTVHRTIKMKPSEVNSSNEKQLLNTVYNYKFTKKEKQKFYVNDFVRISKFKTIFEKGYLTNWSYEIFQIARVQDTKPLTYILRDYDGVNGGFLSNGITSSRRSPNLSCQKNY